MKRSLEPNLAPGDYTHLLRPETVERWQAIAARERTRKNAERHPDHAAELAERLARKGFDLEQLLEGDES